jgi:endoglucanase
MSNQTAYLDGMLRWGLDWMIKVCLLRHHGYHFRVLIKVSHRRIPRIIRFMYKLVTVSINIFSLALIFFLSDSRGNVDNAYWGGDRSIPTPRLSYQINDTQ